MATPSPLPNASATVRGAITAAAQTLAGLKTFNDGVSAVDGGRARRFRPVVHVADYGAVGNGVTNDAVAIQAAIDDAVLLKRTVQFDALTYLVSTELTCRGNPVHLKGVSVIGNVSTMILAGAAIRSCLAIGGTGPGYLVSDITFHAARLAQYAVFVQGVSLSYLERVVVRGALYDGMYLSDIRDGGAAAINDTNHFVSFSAVSNGTLFITSALAAAEPAAYGFFTSISTLLPTASCTLNSTNTVTLTNFNPATSGVRIGDPIRVGTGANARWGCVASVAAGSVTISPAVNVTAATQDFAIGRGSGLFEIRSGDNNRQNFTGGGLSRGNAGFAFRFAGLYGPVMIGPQIDYHAFYAIGVGEPGGAATLLAKFDGLYLEAIGRKNFWANGATGMLVSGCVDSMATQADGNIDYGTPGTCTGVYTNASGVSEIGSVLGTTTGVAATISSNLLEYGLTKRVKREYIAAGTLVLAGTTAIVHGWGALNPDGADRVLTGTPTLALTSGASLILQGIGLFKVRLQDEATLPGSGLKLKTATLDMTGATTRHFFCDGTYWWEL